MNEIIDPPMPALVEPDPRLFQIVPFMKYDQEGRFTEDGKMGIAIIEAQQRAGERILINVLPDRGTEWFDGTAIVPRPVLAVPATLEVPAGEETAAFELPACKAVFTGPVGVEYEHPGGPFRVGFTVPGIYTIKAEPFPAQPFTITLTVTA